MVQEVVVRGFLPGLLVGLVAGGGGTYLALEQPWKSGTGEAASAPDAGDEPAATPKKKKKPRRTKRRSADTGDDGVPVLTEADRKLVWKGPGVELPAKQVDMAAGGGGRSLSGAEINDTIKRRSGAVIDCIEKATGNAPLKAKVTLKLLVDGNGRVTKARLRAPAYLFDHGFYACARAAADELVFPPTGAHTVVTAPFDIY